MAVQHFRDADGTDAMSEVISIRFPDISGDVSAYTAFMRSESGVLLNSGSGGGDAIAETGSTGHWTFTLAEDRAANEDYYVAIYSGTGETAANLVYDGILYSGQTLVDKEDEALNTTLIRGTVGASPTPTQSAFTPSLLSTAASVLNQFSGRVIIFSNKTTTAALRGQATIIYGNSPSALPVLTVEELTTAPVSGDTFRIV